MTLLQHFVESVTGSGLPQNFQRVRIYITSGIAVFLALIFLLVGALINEANRVAFSTFRPENTSLKSLIIPFELNPIRKKYELERALAFDGLQKTLVVSGVSLLLALLIIAWIALYFVLKPLARSLTEKEQFVSRASHELRTPLAILYSELSLSQNSKNIEELRSSQISALEEIKRLQKLSDTLLGRTTLIEVKTLSIKKHLEEVFQKLRSKNTKNIKLIFEGDLKTMVSTEAEQFHQLLYNIIENALKHGDKGTVIATISKYNLLISNPTRALEYDPGFGLQVAGDLAKNLGMKCTQFIEDNTFNVLIEYKW